MWNPFEIKAFLKVNFFLDLPCYTILADEPFFFIVCVSTKVIHIQFSAGAWIAHNTVVGRTLWAYIVHGRGCRCRGFADWKDAPASICIGIVQQRFINHCLIHNFVVSNLVCVQKVEHVLFQLTLIKRASGWCCLVQVQQQDKIGPAHIDKCRWSSILWNIRLAQKKRVWVWMHGIRHHLLTLNICLALMKWYK